MKNMPGIARFECDGTILSAHKLPIMKPAKVTSKGHGVRVEGFVSVSFRVSNQHEKTESHLLTSTRRPQRKAAPLCEQWSQTCATYVVIGTVVWSFIHIAVLLNATGFKHIKTGRKETHKKKIAKGMTVVSVNRNCIIFDSPHTYSNM